MITVYTGNGCAYCPMVKKFLTMKKVQFEEINVDEHPTINRKRMVEITGFTNVPITETEKGIVVGWNPQRLAELIKGESNG